MNDSIHPPSADPSRTRRNRRAVWGFTVLAAVATVTVAIHQHSNAQDDGSPSLDPRQAVPPKVKVESRTVRVPKVVTSFREERVGDSVRRVPVQTVVMEHQTVEHPIRLQSQSGFTYQTVRPGLPHADEITPLVEQILRRRSTQESLAADEELPPSKLDTQLRDMLGEQFDSMHAQQAAEMETLEKRLQTLRQQHTARADAREEIIARRMNELLRQPDPLAWDPAAKPLPGPGVSGRSAWFSKPTTQPAHAIVVPNPSQYSPAKRFSGVSTDGFNPNRGPRPNQGGSHPAVPVFPKRPSASASAFPPAEIQLHFRSTDISEEAINQLVDEVYSAIGRVSADKNDANVKQMNQAIMKAERAIAEAKEFPASRHATVRSVQKLEAGVSKIREAVEAAMKMANQRARARSALESSQTLEKVMRSRQQRSGNPSVEDAEADYEVEVLIDGETEVGDERDLDASDLEEDAKETVEEEVELLRSN